MKLEAGTSIGPYRIVSELGRGGMATVYKAHQAALARYVAIKVLPEFFATEPGFKERFQQEAVAVANLRHPNIPAVFDYGETDGITYIVTEFVDGGTLTEQLGKPLPLEYAIEVLTPLAGALDYAHSRGVLHRDIKPSNVLLEHDGTPILSDFGLAKMMTGSPKGLTQSGMIVGTPEYMAPEQCAGTPDLTPAADLYALGVVAYEMLTGRPPFIADTPVAVIMAQINNTLPPPRQLNPDISEPVEKVLLKALAKEPKDRYRTCQIFIRELSEAASAKVAASAAPAVSAASAAPPGPAAPVAPSSPPISAPPPPSYGPPTPPPQPTPVPPAFTQPNYSAPPSPWPPYQAPASQTPYQSPSTPAPWQAAPTPAPYQRSMGTGVMAPVASGSGSTARLWLIVLLAASVVLLALSALLWVFGMIGSSDSSTLTTAIVLFVISLVLAVPPGIALIGVAQRRPWGTVMSYISAGLLCLTCAGLLLGVPIALLAYANRGQAHSSN